MIKFILNEKEISTEHPPGMTVLDFVRYEQNLKGTKIGCREGDCGACTVLIGEIKNDELQYCSMTSCLMPIGNAHGKHIVTIEGINMIELNAVQQAMADEGATQCGFCTPGFVMSFAGFCLSEKDATVENAIASVDGNICRCTGYKSIERAAIRLAKLMEITTKTEPAVFAAKEQMLPAYFGEIKKRLKTLSINVNGLDTSSSDSATCIGGGTDLYVQKHDEMTHNIIDFLFERNEMKGIAREGNKCIMGASTTVTDLCESEIIQEFFPAFLKYAKLVSSTPIRNMATIAGNFVNASPIGDFTIFFLALDATLVLSDKKNKREIALKNFYKGYKTLDKKPDEIIEQFYFELPGSTTKFNFEKVSKRTHLDIASVNSAISIQLGKNKIVKVHAATGGVYAYPLYLKKTCGYLNVKEISESTLISANEILQAEISPISDARGTADYKRLLARQLFFAHFMELFPEIVKIEKLILN